MHLHRHHVLLEQRVRREGGDPWDIANSMLLHPDCHDEHHSGAPHARRIKLANVPLAAVAFAVDLLGEDGAVRYFAARYAT